MRCLVVVLLLGASTPAMAQHSGHAMPADEQPATDVRSPHMEQHNHINHSKMQHDEPLDEAASEPVDHGMMDHGRMGHAPHQQAAPSGSSAPLRGVGPARAADAIWGAEAMQASREALAREHGAMTVFWLQGDRVEYRARQGRDGYLWDVQGLAPYLFEVDAAAFVSAQGDLTGRVEAELDQRITQRLILQPRAELEVAAQDIQELGIGAGLDSAELGLRLRYEIAREFAPYVGVEQEWKLGRSADFAREGGENRSVTNLVAGVRFWF